MIGATLSRILASAAAIVLSAAANPAYAEGLPVEVTGQIIAAPAGAPIEMTSCSMRLASVAGLPRVAVRNRNALHALTYEQVRFRGYNARGLLLGEKTIEWVDSDVPSGQTGSFRLGNTGDVVTYDGFESTATMTCELVAAGFDDHSSWSPGVVWKSKIISAGDAVVQAPANVTAPLTQPTAIGVTILASWVTPIPKSTDTYAHVRVSLSGTDVPVVVAPHNFVVTLALADGSVARFSGLDRKAPAVRQSTTYVQTVDPSEDFGAIGPVTLKAGEPETLVITYRLPNTPPTDAPFQGIEYVAGASPATAASR